jgi:hypothetical protein
MNMKEIALLGKAMQALIKLGAVDEVKEIIDYMANIDKQPSRENE